MIKKLAKHGNSLALILDRPVLDLLKIDEDTPLEITTDGSTLWIAPVREIARRKKIDKVLERTHRKFGKVFKRLANR